MSTLQKSVSLTYPIATAKDGTAQTIDVLIVKRPRTKHVKAITALLGPSLVKLLLADLPQDALRDPSKAKIDLSTLDFDLVASMLSLNNLDALTGVIADLSGISPAEADELDATDLIKVVAAVAGFFPGLAGLIGSSSSAQT